jgi:hypothetical protein
MALVVLQAPSEKAGDDLDDPARWKALLSNGRAEYALAPNTSY